MPSSTRTDPSQSAPPPQAPSHCEIAIGPVSAVTIARRGKVRLVVGLVGNAEELALALADLRARHLRPAQMRVVAQAGALDGALSGWPANDDGRAFGAWVVCRPAEGPVPWTLSPARADQDPAAEHDARALLGLHHWALRRQALQLDHHLRAGGALLLIEPLTDAEEWEACTALLRHGSGVQTHETARLQDPTDGAP
jgi:hypothetical protein